MEYKKLGRSGLWVSRLVLGTMNFGSCVEEREAFRIMDAAAELGINHFDTANNYGKVVHREGIAESIVGKWFSQGGGRREKIILSTKVYEPMAENDPNETPGLSAYKIRKHFADSLTRLHTDHIEIYYMHHIDRGVDWNEILPVFQGMLQRREIDYLASSNFAGWNIADVQAAAEKSNMFGIVCEQHKYNLLCRIPELEVIPSVKSHGLGMFAWSPLNRGMLSRNAMKHSIEDDGLKKQLEEYKELCRELGEKEDTVALAWLLHNPALTAPVIGPKSVEHLYDAVHALDLILEDEVLRRLDEIFPGPGGPAPDAYAW